jgi:hypothetical protein
VDDVAAGEHVEEVVEHELVIPRVDGTRNLVSFSSPSSVRFSSKPPTGFFDTHDKDVIDFKHSTKHGYVYIVHELMVL